MEHCCQKLIKHMKIWNFIEKMANFSIYDYLNLYIRVVKSQVSEDTHGSRACCGVHLCVKLM